MQQPDAVRRAQNKSRGGERIGQHGALRHYGGARRRVSGCSASRIQNMIPALISARRADGLIRHVEGFDELVATQRMAGVTVTPRAARTGRARSA